MRLEPHIKINSRRIAKACTIFNNYTFMHYTHVLTNGLFWYSAYNIPANIMIMVKK